jgi:hypothetical protein
MNFLALQLSPPMHLHMRAGSTLLHYAACWRIPSLQGQFSEAELSRLMDACHASQRSRTARQRSCLAALIVVPAGGPAKHTGCRLLLRRPPSFLSHLVHLRRKSTGVPHNVGSHAQQQGGGQQPEHLQQQSPNHQQHLHERRRQHEEHLEQIQEELMVAVEEESLAGSDHHDHSTAGSDVDHDHLADCGHERGAGGAWAQTGLQGLRQSGLVLADEVSAWGAAILMYKKKVGGVLGWGAGGTSRQADALASGACVLPAWECCASCWLGGICNHFSL